MTLNAENHPHSDYKIDNFMTWLQSLPGARINPKIAVVNFHARNAGRGVVAIADIEDDEELFTVPLTDILSVESSAFESFCPDVVQRLDTWNALVLAMIYEDGLGEKSHWWPYLDILPTSFDTLIHWTPSELSELEGSAVLGKIGKEEAEGSFVKTLLPIVQKHADVFGRHEAAFQGSDAKDVLIKLSHRMATLIMACGFDLENEPSSEEYEEADGSSQSAYELNKGMIPLADLLNADADRNNAHLLQNDSSMTMVALKPIQKGEEVFNDYGPLPRSDLLRRYGYVTNRYRKWDVVELNIDALIECCHEQNLLAENEKNERLQLAAAWEVLQDGYDLSRPKENEKFSFESDLLLTMAALLLDSGDYNRAVQAEEAPSKPPLQVQMSLYLALKSVILKRKQSYRTTIAEDVSLLENSVSGRRRMAIEVRLGEKEILALAAEELDQQITKLIQSQDETDKSQTKKRKV